MNEWEWTDFDDYSKKYGHNNAEATKFISTAGFFNGLGLLVKMGLFDIKVVQDWSPEACIWFWEKIEPIVLEMRRRLKAQGRAEWKIWENIEYLYNKMKEGEQQPASKAP